MYSEMLLEAYLRRLRLPAILKTYKAVARDAEANGYGYTQCLCALLEQEVISREKRGIQDRVKKARFPLVKTLDSFDFSAIPTLGNLNANGGQLLFQFLNLRYERRSTVIATNLEFGNWTKVSGDEQLTAALLDRLTHHCHILLMNGDSYRFRQSISARQASVVGIDPRPPHECIEEKDEEKEVDSIGAADP